MAAGDGIGLFYAPVAEQLNIGERAQLYRPLTVSDRRKTPTPLRRKVLEDDDSLAAACGDLLRRDREYRRLTRRVLERQGALRAQVTKPAWATYLRVEEAVNDRAGHELLLVARWAFRAGTRFKRGR